LVVTWLTDAYSVREQAITYGVFAEQPESMPPIFRALFPLLFLALLGVAFVWSIAFEELPPADFAFDNGNEVQTVDPARATGSPENRILNALFEGLLRSLPEPGWEEKYGPDDNVPMTPQPAMADLPEISEDGRVYTYRIKDGRLWSDGSPVTAYDFEWSWMRVLHPESASQYAYQLYYLKGGRAYNTMQLENGDLVEVELADRPNPLQLFPRGTILHGRLKEIRKPKAPVIPEDASEERKNRIEGEWQEKWVYLVEVEEEGKDQPKLRAFSKKPRLSQPLYDGDIEPCMWVLTDFSKTVGVKAVDEKTLVVTLNSATPYFNELVAFYTLYPVHRPTIEKYGSPGWAKPQYLVGNGPFTMEFRRIRDRIRLKKNPKYWDAANVKLNTIDAMAVKSETTSLNLYLDKQIDWATVMPVSTIPKLRKEFGDQFRSAPMLTVYFYRVNTTRPGLRDPRVRRALNLAIDKANICQIITRAGEVPATTFVPPGLAGYESPPGQGFDVEQARKLLAEAGYPNGRGLPVVEILYNDTDAHRTIAERVQQMWRENLGVEARLRGLEWGVYLDAQDKLDYGVARAGWIADYPDPNTFLDLFVSDNPQNQTGWKNARYDELIEGASQESDPEKRLKMLSEAEAILLEEMPIIPFYFYVSKNLVKPYVRGFFNNVQDLHPLTLIEVDKEAKAKALKFGAGEKTAGGAR
jgi:oligopeptide transport system substrate-binding protein